MKADEKRPGGNQAGQMKKRKESKKTFAVAKGVQEGG